MMPTNREPESNTKKGVPIERIIGPQAIAELRKAIQEAGGSEIFVVLKKRGKESGVFDEVTVVCRGTEFEVPALISRATPGDMTLHNHPSGVLRPSQADMRMAGLFGEEGIGSMIINNQVTRAYVVVEPFETPDLVAVEAKGLSDIFGPDGRLAEAIEQFEYRESQAEMAQHVATSLHEGRITCIEAGTGTGKSLAYLIPAMVWARDNRKRVLVATKTITLQEQLLYKDIPLAKSVLKHPPETALIKGRQNYVCLRKLKEAETSQMEFDFGEDHQSVQHELEAISDWIESHPTGDRAELPFQPTREAWEAVQSDSDMCLGSSCPYYQESPFYQSRRKAAKANLLIVNQALLFSDLAIRFSTGNYTASAIIPPYFSVILDEAHSLEDIATDHFGSRLGSFGLRQGVGKFMSIKKNTGLLARLSQRSQKYLKMDFQKTLEDLSFQFQMIRDDMLFTLTEFTDKLHQTYNPEDFKNQQVHLDQTHLQGESMSLVRQGAGALSTQLTRICTALETILEEAKEAFEDKADEMEGFLIEFQARLHRLKDHLPTLKAFGATDMDEHVQWLTLKRWGNHRREFQYQISPIDVSDKLVKGLFNPFHSVIATSATLDLNDTFNFYHRRSGIEKVEEKPVESFQFKSPFPLEQQGHLGILSYAPNPGQRAFSDCVTDCILQLAQIGEGGTMALFTSYALLYDVARKCEQRLADLGIPLYVQGRDPRATLIERFRSTQGVLIGTDTFWEGIDLRGRLLTKLLITKLPFRQLGDPVFEARSRKIKAEGGNDFKDYSLPLALLKFKQGAGRLIRSKTDKGLIVIADNRISSKYYGRKFLEMAPEFPKIEFDALTNLQEFLLNGDL